MSQINIRLWLTAFSLIVTVVIVTSCSSSPNSECEPVNAKTQRQLKSHLPADHFEDSGLQLTNFSAIRSKEIDGTWFVASEFIWNHSERQPNNSYNNYLRQQRIGVWAITDFGDGTIHTANLKAAFISPRDWDELRWRDHSEEIEAAEECVRVKIYAEDGADIESKSDDGRTPLHRAAWTNSLDVARLLIDRGAEIDAKNDDGWTPLHGAAWTNSLDFASLLIERGADIDAKDNNGVTPLQWAAFDNSLDVARLLIEKGANTDGIDLSWMDDQEDA